MYLRMKPCGAACAWASVAILLFLRLPCRQPLTELLIADDLYDSVHLVMTEPAKLRAGKLELSGLNRREVHVNGQPRHGVLFEAHRRHEEAMDHVVRPQDHFNLAIHWHDHGSRDHVVLRSRIGRVQPQSSGTA